MALLRASTTVPVSSEQTTLLRPASTATATQTTTLTPLTSKLSASMLAQNVAPMAVVSPQPSTLALAPAAANVAPTTTTLSTVMQRLATAVSPTSTVQLAPAARVVSAPEPSLVPMASQYSVRPPTLTSSASVMQVPVLSSAASQVGVQQPKIELAPAASNMTVRPSFDIPSSIQALPSTVRPQQEQDMLSLPTTSRTPTTTTSTAPIVNRVPTTSEAVTTLRPTTTVQSLYSLFVPKQAETTAPVTSKVAIPTATRPTTGLTDLLRSATQKVASAAPIVLGKPAAAAPQQEQVKIGPTTQLQIPPGMTAEQPPVVGAQAGGVPWLAVGAGVVGLGVVGYLIYRVAKKG